jgi:hypothetical protein
MPAQPDARLTRASWSTTVKTVEKSNFFLQIPLIWKRFWPQLSLFFVMVVSRARTGNKTHTADVPQVAMIVFAVLPQIPPGYRITNIEVIIPVSIIAGSHLLYPFALNPWFLSFSVSGTWCTGTICRTRLTRAVLSGVRKRSLLHCERCSMLHIRALL